MFNDNDLIRLQEKARQLRADYFRSLFSRKRK